MKKEQISTSQEAYHSLDPEKVSDIQKRIVQTLRIIGPATYEEIAIKMKVDPSRVWKRMSEGNRMGIVERTGGQKKLSSGRYGFLWQATDKLPSTECVLPGKSIADFSRAINQVSPSLRTQQTLF